jgi:hypothetical protein
MSRAPIPIPETVKPVAAARFFFLLNKRATERATPRAALIATPAPGGSSDAMSGDFVTSSMARSVLEAASPFVRPAARAVMEAAPAGMGIVADPSQPSLVRRMFHRRLGSLGIPEILPRPIPSRLDGSSIDPFSRSTTA